MFMDKKLLFLIILIALSLNSFSQNQELKVQIDGIRSENGTIILNLFNSEEGFPEDASSAYTWKRAAIKGQEAEIVFMDLQPGIYAIAILHDENRNNRMEKNFLGIPREGFAFSNNYKPLISSPSFREASFSYEGGSKVLKIKMLYF